ncbi:unnamed protein product [Bursaphelenchus okinawaensis]|uniref:RING-type domain-containing protein n=1 Tax=Bursaphelenchus okinawaensis TaxID=465554 RepID=A0A811JU54_9BILA|nr:unnamed protein product [Bursaphelenchus okinawaensis]CAG9082715.1 unnamed protein product [Bursaphelenchus okinawaensis]
MPYYCYQCERTVDANQHLRCSSCDGEFIEEVAPQPAFNITNRGPAQISFFVGGNRVNSGAQPEGFPAFLQSLIGAAGPSSGSLFFAQPSGDSRQNNAPRQPSPNNSNANGQQQSGSNNPNEIFGQFLNQIMANLSSNVPQGGQVHIQIGRGNNGGGVTTNLGDYALGDANFDEIITQLLNGYEQNIGLSKSDIKRVPIINVTSTHVENGTQCTTCFDNFELDQEVAQLNCKHIFHKDCITPWLERQKTCPICRQPVDPSQWPEGEKDRVITDVDELD